MSNNRRDYGTGSVSQRKDGTWTARLTIGKNENGSPRIKAFYGKSEREVKRKMNDFKSVLYKYDKVTASRGTVGDYMKTWLYETKINDVKDNSFDRLEQTFLYQVLPNIGDIQLAALTADNIQAMINKLKGEGLAYSTVKKAYNLCNNCFKAGVEKHTMPFNPVAGVKLPAKDKFKQVSKDGEEKEDDDVKFYSVAEANMICEAATRRYGNGKQIYRLGYAIILDLNTGLRDGELRSLKWDDVDFDNRIIKVRSTQVRYKNRSGKPGKKYIERRKNSTKSKAGMREIYLNDAAFDAIQHLKEINSEFSYVCASEAGTSVNQRNLFRMFNKITAAAGLPEEKRYGLHSLRHTFASMLIANGENVKTVSELLGHSDTTVTYNTYVHLFKNQKKTAIKKIGNFIQELSTSDVV